jgi:N-acetylglucosaminyldiphosphoundecaprenol N-acetyl-beta-D-mannosaminyltransferase
LKRVLIGNTPIDVINVKDGAFWVRKRLNEGKRTFVAPINAALVVMASRDHEFREVLFNFDLILADGFWPALAATCIYRTHIPHTNTLPFIRALFENTEEEKFKVFLLGARAEVVSSAAIRLKNIHTNVKVVGCRDGYFNSDEELEVVDQINKSGAKILLIGMGSPKKEFFAQKYCDKLHIQVSVGVGGLFDIWGGSISEAPNWVRRCGFEWFYRLFQEPRRLWKRYTVDNFRFILLVLRQYFGNHSHIFP